MKNFKKFLKKNKKLITIVGVLILIIVSIILIYKIFFGSSGSDRYEGINSHKLSKSEIADVKGIINELGEIKNIKVYTKSKIIKIIVNLNSDVEFDAVKNTATKVISKINKKNLEFYDVELFVDAKKDSKVYPRIGYKHKTSENFSW